MLPRVAFEYGHTWWAAITSPSATLKSEIENYKTVFKAANIPVQ